MEAAINSYNNLLRLQPENKNGLTNLQVAYRNGGRFFGEKKSDLQTSIAYLNEAYKLNPTDYETLRLLGVSNGIGQNLELAVRYFEEAVKVKPNEAYAYYNLGNAYYNLGEKDKGLLAHQKAVEIDPSLQEKIRK
jgi:tetratricopeptide (TPR) repeat protein